MKVAKVLFAGLLVGAISATLVMVFSLSIDWLAALFQQNTLLCVGMPVVGLLTYALYEALGVPFALGTADVVKKAADSRTVSLSVAPAIFAGTCLSIVSGGSVGKEAAALQIGAAVSSCARLVPSLREEWDQWGSRLFTMCGMAAAFSILLGAPLAAIAFVFELFRTCDKGKTGFIAVACSSCVAHVLFRAMSMDSMACEIETPVLDEFLVVLVSSVLVASVLVGVAFCVLLTHGKKLVARSGVPSWAFVSIGGVVYAFALLLTGCFEVSGTGMNQVVAALSGGVDGPYFAGKLLATAAFLVLGFKGGEIMPVLCIGATLGCFLGFVVGAAPSFAASLGLVVMFATCTNCPVSAVLLGVESFGLLLLPWYALGGLLAFLTTSRVSLYSNGVDLREIGDFIYKRTRRFQGLS